MFAAENQQRARLVAARPTFTSFIPPSPSSSFPSFPFSSSTRSQPLGSSSSSQSDSSSSRTGSAGDDFGGFFSTFELQSADHLPPPSSNHLPPPSPSFPPSVPLSSLPVPSPLIPHSFDASPPLGFGGGWASENPFASEVASKPEKGIQVRNSTPEVGFTLFKASEEIRTSQACQACRARKSKVSQTACLVSGGEGREDDTLDASTPVSVPRASLIRLLSLFSLFLLSSASQCDGKASCIRCEKKGIPCIYGSKVVRVAGKPAENSRSSTTAALLSCYTTQAFVDQKPVLSSSESLSKSERGTQRRHAQPSTHPYPSTLRRAPLGSPLPSPPIQNPSHSNPPLFGFPTSSYDHSSRSLPPPQHNLPSHTPPPPPPRSPIQPYPPPSRSFDNYVAEPTKDTFSSFDHIPTSYEHHTYNHHPSHSNVGLGLNASYPPSKYHDNPPPQPFLQPNPMYSALPRAWSSSSNLGHHPHPVPFLGSNGGYEFVTSVQRSWGDQTWEEFRFSG
ncbi:hypothetical protein BDY24DRAFT_378906 [Mrakia frigida]|uniref:uncharacterized protein n=1 Tax=Mrakia frigida TaxID=29902 RepID=UPI003FCC0B26